ncbi:hypothetical protein TNIN_29341 [Trichonephila inaurata madagascariensis]|uniref:Uncharacterized protein n=1 Tax=Trichonephila inaurata madagascariensis TaxID=2747483 RepID=A0A8X7CK13_9ARAC|nr:hypothetical protein TNIN_29341 [Trichonephila inaurata madagascariensis]
MGPILVFFLIRKFKILKAKKVPEKQKQINPKCHPKGKEGTGKKSQKNIEENGKMKLPKKKVKENQTDENGTFKGVENFKKQEEKSIVYKRCKEGFGEVEKRDVSKMSTPFKNGFWKDKEKVAYSYNPQ